MLWQLSWQMEGVVPIDVQMDRCGEGSQLRLQPMGEGGGGESRRQSNVAHAAVAGGDCSTTRSSGGGGRDDARPGAPL